MNVLPADFASDRQRLSRFEQEAKTLASLDHPNILSIFEVGTQEGTPNLVSQLLEGHTLREGLKSGALPQRKAIDYDQINSPSTTRNALPERTVTVSAPGITGSSQGHAVIQADPATSGTQVFV